MHRTLVIFQILSIAYLQDKDKYDMFKQIYSKEPILTIFNLFFFYFGSILVHLQGD